MGMLTLLSAPFCAHFVRRVSQHTDLLHRLQNAPKELEKPRRSASACNLPAARLLENACTPRTPERNSGPRIALGSRLRGLKEARAIDEMAPIISSPLETPPRLYQPRLEQPNTYSNMLCWALQEQLSAQRPTANICIWMWIIFEALLQLILRSVRHISDSHSLSKVPNCYTNFTRQVNLTRAHTAT